MSRAEGARVFTITLFGVFWLFGTGFAETPKILPDQVIFVGGKIVGYEASKVLQPDPKSIRTEQAVSFTERPILLETLKRVVFVRQEQFFEGGSMQLSVYDFQGTLLGSSGPVEVEVDGLFFLESKKRIFLGQSSSHAQVDGSLLLDENGGLVRRVSHSGAVGSFGHSSDERLIWIVANIWVRPPGKVIADKIGELRVVDTDGNVVSRREFERSQAVSLRYRGKTYKIPVEVPTHP